MSSLLTSESLLFEEHKLNELFSIQVNYNFEALKLVIQKLLSSNHNQQKQIDAIVSSITNNTPLNLPKAGGPGSSQDQVNEHAVLIRQLRDIFVKNREEQEKKNSTFQDVLNLHNLSLQDIEQQLKSLKEVITTKIPSIDKNASYAVKTVNNLKNQSNKINLQVLLVSQLKGALAPDMEMRDDDNMSQAISQQQDILQDQIDKMNTQIDDLTRELLRRLKDEELNRSKHDQSLELEISKVNERIQEITDKIQAGIIGNGNTTNQAAQKVKVKPQTSGNQRNPKDLGDEESDDQLKKTQERNPLDKEFQTQDNYFKLSPDQVYSYVRKQVQKLKRNIQENLDVHLQAQNENNQKFSDLRKLINDLNINLNHQLNEQQQQNNAKLQEEIVRLMEEIGKKADQVEVDKFYDVHNNFEQRISPLESMKLMMEMAQVTQEERINTLKFKMEAFDHKMGLVLSKLAVLSNGTLDKSLTQSIEEIAMQKRQIEENMSTSVGGGGGGAGNRELTDKVQRCYHQLEELKKSYFKKMKDVDSQLSQKATKEQLSATENILELTFGQLGDKFAAKNQTSESLFKLKSQMKSIFELLLSSGVINLNEEDQNEDHAMFSKKQLNPLTCASCEGKIKNLSQKPGGYTQWNRMPFRDPMDRLPRAGQGFSKILQSIKTPRDVQWEDDHQHIQLVNPPTLNQNFQHQAHSLTKTKLSKSHMLIPQPIQNDSLQQQQIQQQQHNLDLNLLPKITTPRKND
ncbi:UNKNOWN [Stylonychia lemnae]|uniref:Glutamine-rich protein 2 n=1 Tax=Stylonychia lemnae TaxID=5949 RepID=A0A078B481_STYLE|nr:UNKNOWN [Stylonychia lemnae]|eukprot:CDW89284.1 UNKNOWN [Stylonychia lemnae]